MKKYAILSLALAFGLIFSAKRASAQESFGSAGLEIALPMSDFSDAFSLGYGISGAYEYGLTDNIGVNATAGYILLSPASKVKDIVKSGYMVPIQVGANYYFDKAKSGLYAGVKVGVHLVGSKTKDITTAGITVSGTSTSNTDFGFAPQVGYFISENLSVDVRYQLMTDKQDVTVPTGVTIDPVTYQPITTYGTETVKSHYNYLGLRIAYNF